MLKQQKTTTFLVSLYWIMASLKLFSQTSVLSEASIRENLIWVLIFGVSLSIVAYYPGMPVITRAQTIVTLIIIQDLLAAFYDNRFLHVPIAISIIAVAITTLRNERLVAFTGIAGNVLCILFFILFPDIAIHTIETKQIVFLMILMDAVIVYTYLIVAWINKQVAYAEKIAFEADAASTAKDEFLASVSHEIRTPMNAIFGMTEIMLAAPEHADIGELKDKANVIKIASYELLTLINDILDISKIGKGKMEIIEAPYNANSLFKNLEVLTWKKIESKNIVLRSKLDFSAAECLIGDDVRIRQICMNLLSNAVKYTDEGYVELNVREIRTSYGVDLIIVISDTGIGMSEERINKLLSNYQMTSDERNQIDGMGFGLAITTSLIEIMGGSISATSKINDGTTYTVRIPQQISESTVTDDSAISLGQLKMSGIRALIVDDNAINIQISHGIFKSYDIDADTAVSGKEAIEKASENRYDIIFMDYRMPGMDGVAAARSIRKTGKSGCDTVPIIAMTASTDHCDLEYFRDNGLDGYMAKPISVLELERIFRTFLIDKVPEEKPCACGDSPGGSMWIAGVDISKGIENCGGTMNMFVDVLKVFHTSGTNQLETIQNAYENNDIDRVAIEAHSLKSVAKGIGADLLGDQAKIVEMAAKEKDLATLSLNISPMLKQYGDLLDNVGKSLNTNEPERDDEERSQINSQELVERLKELADASKNYMLADANEIVDELLGCSVDDETHEKLKEIKLNISQFSYVNTIECTEDLIAMIE